MKFKKIFQLIFDLIIILVVRAVCCFMATATQGADLSTSTIVWIVSIILGLFFAEFFEIKLKQ